MLVIFYYLLRKGEYTKPNFAVQNGKRVPEKRTQQFVARNVGFFKDGKIIKHNDPLAELLAANLAVLKTNQKNGRNGASYNTARYVKYNVSGQSPCTYCA